ncbi:Signal recognition particle 54 kDa protein [Plasmodiophora brassicae]|uniref:Signal recognition particle 54 kDa protein n=2 Tax=Plasmodiophora brassicae TaxID=37360 RepID=A0A3P3YAA7_PLABS|nr:unnamed protein product [Plasmodiophora brassicae]
MVLADLGGRLQSALRALSTVSVVDEDMFKSLLASIQRALLQADVNVRLVGQLCNSIKSKASIEDMAAGHNRRAVIQKAVFESLCELLDPGKEPFKPVRGKPNVIMFVGLQGSGKTTSCTKLAYWYQKRGWKTCLVCADTYRAGAYDQLKQNATKANIPYYGSYTERDPVRVAEDGVAHFRAEKYEMIIVDTSGRHRQEAALFEEMEQVAAVVNPDDIVFVMDSSIGQAAHDQALAFRQSVAVGSVIITKLDGHARGGGALSAVAATKSPIVFIGTGEHIQEFEPFSVKSFVSRLLGKGDMAGLVQMFETHTNMEENKETVEKIMQGGFCLRIMAEQLESLMAMGPIGTVMSMIPGLSQVMGGRENESQDRIRRCMIIIDSMTDQEKDATDTKIFDQSRLLRIARGAGVRMGAVEDLFRMYKPMQKMMAKLGNNKMLAAMTKRGGAGGANLNPRQMAQMMDPAMLAQLGGPQGLQQMMKQMQQGGLMR